LNNYNWRQHEAKLNQLPQYTIDIDMEDYGIMQVHFVHKKAVGRKDAIPLIFIHGWPGSFMEVERILPLLTDPRSDSVPAFDVVAPRYTLLPACSLNVESPRICVDYKSIQERIQSRENCRAVQ